MVDCENNRKQYLTTPKMRDVDPPWMVNPFINDRNIRRSLKSQTNKLKLVSRQLVRDGNCSSCYRKNMIKFIKITFIFCLCTTAWGQIATTTSLVGTVSDNTGAVLPGAAVSAVNQENKETYNAVTNGEGYFSVPFIRVGSYNVTVTHPGFQTAKKTGIIIDLNQ